MFASIERCALLPLPTDRFEVTEWKKAKVNIDYHVAFGNRLYSVPHRYVHEEVWICATALVVEVLLRGRRIALHPRNGRLRHATLTEHMPRACCVDAVENPVVGAEARSRYAMSSLSPPCFMLPVHRLGRGDNFSDTEGSCVRACPSRGLSSTCQRATGMALVGPRLCHAAGCSTWMAARDELVLQRKMCLRARDVLRCARESLHALAPKYDRSCRGDAAPSVTLARR